MPVGPVNLIVNPSGQFLYVANFNWAEISAFVINDSDGALKPIPGSPFPVAGTGPNTMGIDPTDTFLYVANADSSSSRRHLTRSRVS
jgi:6-phosphogluconolactonase (cycloisomerase 2 family)